MLPRTILTGLLFSAVMFGASRPAHAVGTVLGAEPTQLRIAVAPAPDRTTRWLSLTVSGSQPFVWIVPMGRQAAVDATSSAWLEALDVVSAPRIASSCGGSTLETVRAIDLGADRPTPKVTIAHDTNELEAAVAGFFLTPEVEANLAKILETHDLAVLRAVAPTPATIRIVDRDAYTNLPFSLLQSPRDVDVVTVVVGRQRSAIGASIDSPATLHWFGSQSDYVLVRDGLFAKSAPGAFLTESALASAVLDNQRVSPEVVNSLATEYFSRTALYGDATGSLVSCVGAATSQAGTVQSPYCARADLGGASILPCATSSAFACGTHADDLALAMSGRVPKDVWITRLVGRIPAAQTAPDTLVTSPGGSDVGLLKIAAGSNCRMSGMTGSGGGSGESGGGYSSGNGGGCSGSVESSSSSSDTDVGGGSADDSCDSSSTDSSGGGDDCDSGDSGGESCDSGGGGGEDCSGGGGGGDCADATPRKGKTAGKSPLSRVTLSAALILLPLRRLTRKKKA